MAFFTISLFFTLCLYAQIALGSVITYNWNLGWINAASDGFNRPVVAINGQFPLPTINVTLGDQIVINAVNNWEIPLRLYISMASSKMAPTLRMDRFRSLNVPSPLVKA